MKEEEHQEYHTRQWHRLQEEDRCECPPYKETWYNSNDGNSQPSLQSCLKTGGKESYSAARRVTIARNRKSDVSHLVPAREKGDCWRDYVVMWDNNEAYGEDIGRRPRMPSCRSILGGLLIVAADVGLFVGLSRVPRGASDSRAAGGRLGDRGRCSPAMPSAVPSSPGHSGGSEAAAAAGWGPGRRSAFDGRGGSVSAHEGYSRGAAGRQPGWRQGVAVQQGTYWNHPPTLAGTRSSRHSLSNTDDDRCGQVDTYVS